LSNSRPSLDFSQLVDDELNSLDLMIFLFDRPSEMGDEIFSGAKAMTVKSSYSSPLVFSGFLGTHDERNLQLLLAFRLLRFQTKDLENRFRVWALV
jgi:hypothetical protein